VLHTEPGTGTVFDPDRGHVRLLPGLEPKGDEPVLCKTSHNAFTTTNLAQALTSRGVSEVVVTGIRTPASRALSARESRSECARVAA
jgi:nicotinamidase-related amidase